MSFRIGEVSPKRLRGLLVKHLPPKCDQHDDECVEQV